MNACQTVSTWNVKYVGYDFSMRVWLGAGRSGRTWTPHLFFNTASSLSCIETRTWVAATVLQEGHEPSVQHTNAPGTKWHQGQRKFWKCKNPQRWIQPKIKKSVKVAWIRSSLFCIFWGSGHHNAFALPKNSLKFTIHWLVEVCRLCIKAYSTSTPWERRLLPLRLQSVV